MEDFKDKQIVQRVIDNSLSGIQDDPWMAQRVLNMAHEMQGTGGIVVKKKLSVGFVLIMVVLLSSVVALAWSLSQQYFEDVAQLQFSSGYYDDWGWEEKQKMVDIMLEHGLITETEAAELSTEEAVDAYMIEHYGINGRSDVIGLWSILETELGPINTWSLEQKAWCTEMQIEIGLLTENNDDSICTLPEKSDVQPDEAIAIAKAAIIEAYGLEADALDGHQVDIAFETHASDWTRENLHYNISFWGDGMEYYTCSITRDGRIMDSTMDETCPSPAEQVQEKLQFANENDLEAIALFQQYANEHIQDGIYNFDFWPLEDKKAVTDMLRPVILENMAENPDYADQTRIFWATHYYGLPDEKAIPQEKVIEIAKSQLTTTFGLNANQAALIGKVGLFYDVTDPDKPLWKVTLRLNEGTGEEAMAIGLSISGTYRVFIDAYTGEVVATHYFTKVDYTNPADIEMAN